MGAKKQKGGYAGVGEPPSSPAPLWNYSEDLYIENNESFLTELGWAGDRIWLGSKGRNQSFLPQGCPGPRGWHRPLPQQPSPVS